MSNGKSLSQSGEYLSFKLGSELYAIDVLRVKEVVGRQKIAPYPGAPDYVAGVVNLRDRIFPVMDLRTRFGMPSAEETEQTCIVIVDATSPDMKKCWEVKQCAKRECPGYENRDRRCWMLAGTHCRNEIQGSFFDKREACSKCELFIHAVENQTLYNVGMVIDEVCDVLHIPESSIDECPPMIADAGNNYVLGLARHKDKIIKLLDVTNTLDQRVPIPHLDLGTSCPPVFCETSF